MFQFSLFVQGISSSTMIHTVGAFSFTDQTPLMQPYHSQHKRVILQSKMKRKYQNKNQK